MPYPDNFLSFFPDPDFSLQRRGKVIFYEIFSYYLSTNTQLVENYLSTYPPIFQSFSTDVDKVFHLTQKGWRKIFVFSASRKSRACRREFQ